MLLLQLLLLLMLLLLLLLAQQAPVPVMWLYSSLQWRLSFEGTQAACTVASAGRQAGSR